MGWAHNLCLELGQPFGQAHSSEQVRLGFFGNSLTWMMRTLKVWTVERQMRTKHVGKNSEACSNDIKERDGGETQNDDTDFFTLKHLEPCAVRMSAM